MSSPKQNWYAVRVTIGYAIAAILWIFFSDQWLTYLTDFDTVRKLSTGKGLAFVLVTSALLYFTLRTASANGRPLTQAGNTGMSWPLLTVFVVLTATIAGIGLATFRFQSDTLRTNALTGLRAVAELKVEGISRWLEERRANARSLSGSPVVQTTLARWLETGGAGDRAQLTGLLLNLRETYGFSAIAILDPTGKPLLAEPAGDDISPAPSAVMAAAFASKQPLFLDIARREQGAPPVLGFVAPLYRATTGSERGPPTGAIRLELRPEDFLYPFLASWPLNSASGETLIARRDGDDALFLSPPRYRPDGALALRLPLSTPDLPVGLALRLGAQTMWGRDYRGTPVLAAALPVPATPWVLVAKMDEDEALVGMRRLLAVTAVLVAAALCVAAAILVLFWQRQRLQWALGEVAQTLQVAASEAKLRSYIDYSPIAIYVVDETGRFIETNSAGAAMVGYDAATLATLTIGDTIVESDRERALADFQELIRTGLMEAEYQGQAGDGRRPHILVRAAKISETRFIGFSQDITERRVAEQALRQTQELTRLGDYAYDIPGNRWTCSPILDSIFGITAEFPRTVETWMALVHPSQREEMGAYLHCVLELAAPFDAEYRIIRMDSGEERWVHGLGRFDTDSEGRAVRLYGTIQDITERKRAEAEIQALNADLERRVEERTAELISANRELDSFAYAVSHDLRAPLRALGGFSTALIEDYGEQLTGEAHEYLGHIIAASRKMSELVEGLLVLSRCTRGEIRRDRVDVSALAAMIANEFHGIYREKHITCRIEPGLQVRGDARMIEVVMRNLMANAWKYTGYAGEAEVRVHRREENGESWICVADNGAGFDMAHAGKLFTPFQRLHREDEFPGIGIGLATVQRIIHRHGGTILGEGAVGRGACFRFTLPAAEAGIAA